MKRFFQEKIRKRYSKLTPSQAALSNYILEHSEEVAFFSSALLARKVHVSDATVTRFCLALGYSGYADFQRDLQRWIQNKLAPSERVEKAIHQKKDNLYLQIFRQDLKNLQDTIDNLSIPHFNEAIRLLLQSERVFIIGLRSSFSLAYLLYHLLRKIIRKTVLLDPAFGLLYDPLIDIGPKDTLVMISFFQYAKWTLQVAEYCKDRRARIITLTDNIISPPAQISDIVLQVKTASSSFFNSYTSSICLINCLVTGVSLANSASSIRALQKIENSLPQDTWVMKH
jgi:DNA-binding MurR/RpiR family transcriptional regulator